MKIVERILGGLTILAIILNFLLVPTAGIFTIIFFGFLTMFYFLASFLLLNDVRLKDIAIAGTFKNISALKIFGSIFTGIALTITLMGILFKIQWYPRSEPMMMLGLIFLGIISVISILKYIQTKSPFYTNVLKRIAVIGGFALLLLLIPKYTWMELSYRDYPEYVEAAIAYDKDPTNEELRLKLVEQRDKMYYKRMGLNEDGTFEP